MWHTPEGDRKLEGAERRLFILGLLEQIATFTEDEDWEFQAQVLNQIHQDDRRYIFLLAAEQLLGDGPVSELQAWNEAVVWEVFKNIESMLEMEIEVPNFKSIRRAIREACLERFDDRKPTRLNSVSKKAWNGDIYNLSDQILWDEDFLMYEDFADHRSPDVLKEWAGINEGYYSATPTIKDEDRKRLEGLCDTLAAQVSGWHDGRLKPGAMSPKA